MTVEWAFVIMSRKLRRIPVNLQSQDTDAVLVDVRKIIAEQLGKDAAEVSSPINDAALHRVGSAEPRRSTTILSVAAVPANLL